MASKKDLRELLERSKNATGGGRWLPDDGEKFSFRIIKSNTSEYKGYDSWGIQLEVTQGDNKEKRVWGNLGFNPDQDFVNKRTFDNFEALGIPADTVLDTDPTVIREMLTGKSGVAVASVRPKDNGNGHWVNFEFEASRKVAPPPPEHSSNGEADDDDGWDD